MENSKFQKGQAIRLLKDCSDAPRTIQKGTEGVITHKYDSGNIRIASNAGENWHWEVYLHHTFIFSDTIATAL